MADRRSTAAVSAFWLLSGAQVALRPYPARPRQRRAIDRGADPRIVRPCLRQRGAGSVEDQATLPLSAVRLPRSASDGSEQLAESGKREAERGRIAFTTDSFVVRPLFFPGRRHRPAGSAWHGERSGGGRRSPLFLSAAFILEEGLPLTDLRRIVASMRQACTEAGVALVTGDTKVVDRGKGDGVFITTIGHRPGAGRSLAVDPQRPARRSHPRFGNDRRSRHRHHVGARRAGVRDGPGERHALRWRDLAEVMLEACPRIRCMRDPTRGGVVQRPERIGRRLRRGRASWTRRPSRYGPKSAAPARCSDSIRSMSPTRAN